MSSNLYHKHNYYFGTSSRKFCDENHSKSQTYFWGSYICGRFSTIRYFCSVCYNDKIRQNIIKHQESDKCTATIKGYNKERLPLFLLELQNELNGNKQLYLKLETNNETFNSNSSSNAFTLF